MLRLIFIFLYMSGYLVYSIPKLRKMQALPKGMSVKEKDILIQETPKKWSETIMKMTGSKVEVRGNHNLPDGPVLIVANHEGDFDIPLLLGFLNKPFGFISKIEVKKVPVLSKWMDVMNCVYLDRKDRRQAVRSIREGVKMLKEGHSILIFPEGTRSKGGPIEEFKSGSLRLAKDAGVPIVPVSIEGTAEVFEKNGRLIKPANITLTICPPISFEEYQEKELKVVAKELRELIIMNRKEYKISS
ncbi:lysophospholipid acyltransferase family protein [Mesobacillus maritimus]|uniref:1-acyl-sn-glycerol-3-phosphate acyltransferase n=1 Tax=Mesobacillus maritimus TaxID=1643336 RepID=A0ABS7K355_9BACI|nr:lysophospholipid acyltransferase family protein [Mesobacillus maritimus]MBY0096638.1 1-acyl-sn-glycerol-3-phosphate acyltransferase [Mesobacillus maritimus]